MRAAAQEKNGYPGNDKVARTYAALPAL